MKHLIAALALALLATSSVRAEAATPPTLVGWSSIASGCSIDNPSLASVDSAHGTVTFAPGKSGRIKMTCPVRSAFFAWMSKLHMVFYNDRSFSGGATHCAISADLLRTNLNEEVLGWDIVSISTETHATTGRSELQKSFAEALDFDSSYYWVDVELSRDSGTATCNPVILGVYLANQGVN